VSWPAIARAALRSVARRPLRNGLATLGVALATATLVALLALSSGLQQQLLERVSERRFLTTIHTARAVIKLAVRPGGPLDGASRAAHREGALRRFLMICRLE